MKNIVLFVLIIALILPVNMFGKEYRYKEFSNSVGMKASNMSGYGFFYNRKINEDFNVQVMGLIYYYYNQEDVRIHTIFNYDIGAEIQMNVFKTERSRLYFLAGGYYYFDDDLSESDKILTLNTVNNSYNAGVGVAWEIYFSRFIASIDIGYKYFEDNKDVTEKDKIPYPELHRVTKIGAGFTVGFMF